MSAPARIRPTLVLKLPAGQVVLSTIIALIIVSACSETLARNEAVRPFLYKPRINGSDKIALKLLDLDALAAKSKRLDCIAIGSSMVERGISPANIREGYQQKLNAPFQCTNFGLDSIDTVTAAKLAGVLKQEYRPRLLIYGLSFRDFVSHPDVLDIPWMRYYLGRPSLEGWLDVHSQAYRYGLGYRKLLASKALFKQNTNPDDASEGDDQGADETGAPAEVDLPGGNDARLMARYGPVSENYEMLDTRLAGLEQLLAMNSPEQQILLIEMPLAPGVYDALPNGHRTRSQFTKEVAARAAGRGVQFWLTQDAIRFSDDSWHDPFHLNSRGARVLGLWLGAQLASQVQSGQLHPLTQ